MAVPEMAALVPPADEKLGGSVLEAGGDVEIDLGGLSFSLRIGEIEKVKGGGTVAVGRGGDGCGEVNGFSRGDAKIGGYDFVDDVATNVLTDDLKSEIARLVSRLSGGNDEGPAGGAVVAVPAGDEGVCAGVGVDGVEGGHGFDGEGVSEDVFGFFPLQLLELASRLEPKGA